ncbi:hypothetical protein B0A52_10281 [Exophiala mesophila]|uniref:Dynactin subunit 4 n=1 Tax=Exophiala mesophila TaxID=212818 RepID=A0A438MSF5_EXOME|nr:hypothetical protein B0A52_10281 [Exophiala mesophila]
MALRFPYTFISCPCSDASNRVSREVDYDQEVQDTEETFDPRHPRSAFSLFPPEHLLYCEECHDIKCPRCVTEEIASPYCPDCLFETSKSTMRSDGGRCPRNCFRCPICTSQMITASVGETRDGPFILSCNYCMWNTLDIGIKFSKGTGIRAQLDDLLNGASAKGHNKPRIDDQARSSSLSQPPITSTDSDQADSEKKMDFNRRRESAARFDSMTKFYKKQISESTGADATFSNAAINMAYSSPSSIDRIMAIYNTKLDTKKRSEQHVTTMREANSPHEGFKESDSRSSSPFPCEYSATTTRTQRDHQNPSNLGNPGAAVESQLVPMSTPFRTKRLKRCMNCKHMLTRPELKVTSARYRVKLIALDYIPFVTIKPLPVPGGLSAPGPDGADIALQSGKAVQFIMTLRNPLFEDVKVSLGSPSVTPGKLGHRVTILCPQFEIGKNSDAWDDAINRNASSAANRAGEQIAGKLYDQGRNWASVVVEVIPARLVTGPGGDVGEDEDVIEIPIRVRLEWQVTEDQEPGDERRRKERDKGLDQGDDMRDSGKRELSYWMVAGVGRVDF